MSSYFPYNTIIGYAPYNIPIYDNSKYMLVNIEHFGSKGTKYENIFYGIKYQCVEFVRRWYIHVYNLTFESIDNAIDIIKLKHAINIKTNMKMPFIYIQNTLHNTPIFGDIVVWKAINKYIVTGHVCIVTMVYNTSMIEIAEQNGESKTGKRIINIHNNDIIGWMRCIGNYY